MRQDARVVTYTVLLLLAMGAVGVVAAGLAWGFNPLTSLSGTTVGFGRGLGLLAVSLGVYLWPMAGIATFGLMLSTMTRNSAASVVGTLMWALLMQLLGVLPGTEAIRPYLLGTQFQAWHGFLRTPTDWVPIVRARGSAGSMRCYRSRPAMSSSCAATSPASEPAQNARNGDTTRRCGAAGGAGTASLPWRS